MAETYSTEYTVQLQVTPGAKIFGPLLKLACYPFTYTQAANGSINDTIILAKLPPRSILLMHLSRITWAGWTATATIDLGWKTYKDLNGVAVADDPNGLLSAVVLTSASTWFGGMVVLATLDNSEPVVWRKDFSNSEEVLIYATIGVAAPGAADTLEGELVFIEA